MFHSFRLPVEMTSPGKELLRVYHQKRNIPLFSTFTPRVLVGGSSLWQVMNQYVNETQVQSDTDIDSYFVGLTPEDKLIINSQPADIGHPLSHAFPGAQVKGGRAAGFLHIKHQGNDYSIGDWVTYSNFQIGIDVETYEIVYDAKFPDHKESYKKFILQHEITTIPLQELMTQASQHEGPVEHNTAMNRLAYVLKSYIKPFRVNKTFSLETAKMLHALISEPANKNMWPLIAARLHQHYPAVFPSLELAKVHLDLIFSKCTLVMINNQPYQEMNNHLMQINASLMTDLKNRELQIQVRDKELATAKEINETQEKEINALKKELREQKEKVFMLQTTVDSQAKDLKSYQSEVYAAMNLYETTSDKLKLTEDKLAKVSIQHDTLAHSKSDKMKSMEAQIKKLEKELEASNAKMTELVRTNDELSALYKESLSNIVNLATVMTVPPVAEIRSVSAATVSTEAFDADVISVPVTPESNKTPTPTSGPSKSSLKKKKNKENKEKRKALAIDLAQYLSAMIIEFDSRKLDEEEEIAVSAEQAKSIFGELLPSRFESHQAFMSCLLRNVISETSEIPVLTIRDAVALMLYLKWDQHQSGHPTDVSQMVTRYTSELSALEALLNADFIRDSVSEKTRTRLSQVISIYNACFTLNGNPNPEWTASLKRINALIDLYKRFTGPIDRACEMLGNGKILGDQRLSALTGFQQERSALLNQIPQGNNFETVIALELYTWDSELRNSNASSKVMGDLLNQLSSSSANTHHRMNTLYTMSNVAGSSSTTFPQNKSVGAQPSRIK